MTREPRSTPVRTLASLSYLAPFAVAMLVWPEGREIRFLRRHAIASLELAVGSWVGAGVLSWLGTLLGSLPWIGFSFLSLTGLLLMGWLAAGFALAIAGAWEAYQGRAARVLLLDALLRATARDRGSRRRARDPEER